MERQGAEQFPSLREEPLTGADEACLSKQQLSNMTECLETCKLAVAKGLISESDFDTVKSAFLRAQQIKAGLDAGFIREDDYDQVKQAFLSSVLDHLAGSASAAATTDGTGTRAVNGTAAPSPITSSVPPSPIPTKVAPPPPIKAPEPVAPSQPARLSPQGSTPTGGSRILPVPTNLQKIAGQKGLQSGSSISGIAISDDAVNLYYHLKAKAAYRWATWKIDSAGKQVIISDLGDKDSNFDEFLSVLPKNDCRYAVFDYQYVNSEGITYNKIVFLNWAPDTANIRSKMIYASTKDHFKNYLDGISVEFQASDLDEVQETDVHEAVSAIIVRK